MDKVAKRIRKFNCTLPELDLDEDSYLRSKLRNCEHNCDHSHHRNFSFGLHIPGLHLHRVRSHGAIQSLVAANFFKIEFPPPGYVASALNAFLANALDLTAPASDALLKNRKNAWVQLAGHPGAFAPAGPHTIWKRRLMKENNETVAYQKLMCDSIREFVPRFYREVEYNGDLFIEMEDLLQHFTDPCIMDIKMGTRTFLESEVKNPVLRKDLYEKMVKLSASEPTTEEHEQKAITKLRYMQFRERGSSTSSLGFRIEAIRMAGELPNTELKKVRSRTEVKRILAQFLENNTKIRDGMLERFHQLRENFEKSEFMKCHEVIGSSLLLMYDQNKAKAWMIDFAKTLQVEPLHHVLDHRSDWTVGNHEDGYMHGLDNLISIVSEIDSSDASHAISMETTPIIPHKSKTTTHLAEVPSLTNKSQPDKLSTNLNKMDNIKDSSSDSPLQSKQATFAEDSLHTETLSQSHIESTESGGKT